MKCNMRLPLHVLGRRMYCPPMVCLDLIPRVLERWTTIIRTVGTEHHGPVTCCWLGVRCFPNDYIPTVHYLSLFGKAKVSICLDHLVSEVRTDTKYATLAVRPTEAWG